MGKRMTELEEIVEKLINDKEYFQNEFKYKDYRDDVYQDIIELLIERIRTGIEKKRI